MPVKNLKMKYYLLIIGFTIIDFLFGSGYTAFMHARNIDVKELGIIFLCWSLFSFFLEIPSGSIADKYGRKKIMAIGYTIWGCGLFLFSIADDFFFFLLSFFVISLGIALISGTPQAWYISSFEDFDKEHQATLPKAQSISLLFSLFSGTLFAYFVLKGSNSMPYQIGACLSFLLGIYIFRFYKENYHKKEHAANKKISYYFRETVKNIRANKILQFYLLKTLVTQTFIQIFILTWQLYVLDQFQVEQYMLGPILTGFTLALALGYFVASRLILKAHGVMVSIYGAVIIILGAIVILWTSNFVLFSIAAFLVELGIGMESGASMMWIQNEITDDVRSTTLSLFSVLSAMGGIVSSLVITFVIPYTGLYFIWIIVALGGVMTVFVLSRVRRIIAANEQT